MSATTLARTISSIRAHKRAFVVSLTLAFAAFTLIHPDEFGGFLDMAFLAVFVMLIASQFFWVRQSLDVVERFLPGKPRRSSRGVPRLSVLRHLQLPCYRVDQRPCVPCGRYRATLDSESYRPTAEDLLHTRKAAMDEARKRYSEHLAIAHHTNLSVDE
jgi:hypothetical protein